MKEHRIRCKFDNRFRLMNVMLYHFVHENVSSMCRWCSCNLWMLLLRMNNCRNIWFCIINGFTCLQLVFTIHRFFSFEKQFRAMLSKHFLSLLIRCIFYLTTCYLILTIIAWLFMLILYEIIRNIITHLAFITNQTIPSLMLLLNLLSLNINNTFLSFSAPKSISTIPTAIRCLWKAIELLECRYIRRTIRLTLKSL